MGIKGLFQFLKKASPSSFSEIDFSNLQGQKIAFDVSGFLYQFLTAISTTNYYSSESINQNSSHLIGLFHRSIKLISLNIRPIFVFDGAPPEIKSSELANRRIQREKNSLLYEKALLEEDFSLAEKLKKRTITITKNQIEEAKELLSLFGFPIIQAPSEAEAQCANLVKNKLCYAVASDDSDLIPLGCPVILRNFFNSNSKTNNNKKSESIILDDLLKNMDIDFEMLCNFCVLCGSDYNLNIKGLGPVNSLKLIKKYKNIETLLEEYKKGNKEIRNKFGDINNDKLEEITNDLKNALYEFSNPKVLSKIDAQELLVWNDVKYSELKKFLLDKGFDETRIENNFEKIRNIKKKPVQNKLTMFFQKKSK